MNYQISKNEYFKVIVLVENYNITGSGIQLAVGPDEMLNNQLNKFKNKSKFCQV